MERNYIIKDLNHLATFAKEFAKEIKGVPYAFIGDLGAGKTTLIKALGENLKVQSEMTSPTFGLINEYALLNDDFDSLYHMDLYRLEQLEEAYDIGIEEYLYSGNPCFIEWPEIVESILPPETIFIKIEMLADFTRKILFL